MTFGGSLLARASWRTYLRQPAQTVLSVLGIALGVAVVLAVGLTTGSAERAFERAAESVGGRTTHAIRGAGGVRVRPEVYVDLRVLHGVRACAPVVEGQVRAVGSAESDGEETAIRVGPSMSLIGIDPLAEGPLRSYFSFDAEGAGGVSGDFTALATRPGAVGVTRSTAASLGWQLGSKVWIDATGTRTEIEIAALLQPRDGLAERGLDGVLVADISTAIECLGRDDDRLDRIDLLLEDDAVEGVRSALPADVELAPISAQKARFTELTQAFRVNLQALSLLTLLVGALLVFNTVAFSVVRRRGTLGVLRALGTERKKIFVGVVVEALTLGIVGTALGVGLGVFLAWLLLDVVTGAISSLYVSVTVSQIELVPEDLLLACATGIGVCVLAALAPAYEATRVPPREVLLRSPLEARSRSRARYAVLVALTLIGLGVAILFGFGSSMWTGLVGLFLVLVGAAAATPQFTSACARLVTPLCRKVFGPLGAYAARGVGADTSRTAVASAALMLAVATTVGLGAMIASFRTTVEQWLRSTLLADVYVSAPSTRQEHFRVQMDPATVDAVRSNEGVRDAAVLRRFVAASKVGDKVVEDTQCVGVERADLLLTSWSSTDEDDAAVRASFMQGAAGGRNRLVVSEPYSSRYGVGRGDSLELRTPSGWASFEIVGVFYDYGSEAGYLMMTEPVRAAVFGASAPSALGLFVDEGVDPDVVSRAVRTRAEAGGRAVYAQSSRGLLEASLQIFDKTFQTTSALRLLCVIVAFLGVWSALMALALSRRREIAVLRAVGATPKQVSLAAMLQTGILGLAAGLWALPVGAALGWILVHVVNKRSFGWTLLHFDIPTSTAVEALVLAVTAALLAGAWPARQFAKVRIAEALRGD